MVGRQDLAIKMDSDSSYDDEANKADLKAFSESLFSAEEGNEFKELHPTLRLQQPEHLKASIPIVFFIVFWFKH